jgi:magnesium chelatase accessory protein
MTAFDLPGHGESEPIAPADMTLPGLASRAAQLLGRMDIKPRIVVGHSAGAAIALQLVLDGAFKPQVIVSINGALLPFRGLQAVLFPLGARLLASCPPLLQMIGQRTRQPAAVERMLDRVGGRVPPASVARYRSLLVREGHIQAAVHMMARWKLDALYEALPGLQTPLALVACGEDRAVPPDEAWRVADMTPSATVHYLRGLGHLAHEEAPDVISDLVLTIWRTFSGSADLNSGHNSRP